MGDNNDKTAVREEDLKLVGNKLLKRSITTWMSNSIFTGVPSASEIQWVACSICNNLPHLIFDFGEFLIPI